MISMSTTKALSTLVLLAFLQHESSSLVSATDWEATAEASISSSNSISKIAFGSCHKRKYSNRNGVNVWNSIAKEEASAFVWTGDAVYPPNKGVASLSQLSHEYDQMRTNGTLGYKQMLLPDETAGKPPFGIYGTWDDHDFGANDVGKEMTDRQARRKLYMDQFLQYPGSLQEKLEPRAGVYHSVDLVFDDLSNRIVKVIILDTRWNRDYHCIPSVATKIPLGNAIACLTRWFVAGVGSICDTSKSTILGEEQWKWLEQELESSTAPVNIIVSSIQVLSTNPAMEGWGHFPEEQERLLQLLNTFTATKKAGVVILSGDVHHAEILDPTAIVNVKKHSFFEITSSGLTHSCQGPFYGPLCEPLVQAYSEHRRTKSDYFLGLNYGTLEVDWHKQRVRTNIHSADGEPNNNTVLTTGWRSYTTMDALTAGEVQRVPRTVDGHLLKYLKYVAIIALLLAAMAVQLVIWMAYLPTKGDDDDETRKLNMKPKEA